MLARTILKLMWSNCQVCTILISVFLLLSAREYMNSTQIQRMFLLLCLRIPVHPREENKGKTEHTDRQTDFWMYGYLERGRRRPFMIFGVFVCGNTDTGCVSTCLKEQSSVSVEHEDSWLARFLKVKVKGAIAVPLRKPHNAQV